MLVSVSQPLLPRLAMLLPVLLLLTAGGCRSSHPSAATSPPALSPLESRLAAVKQQPENPAARWNLAEAYLQENETFAAIEQLEVARQLGKSDENLYLKLAGLYNALGEYEAAARILAQAAQAPQASAELRVAYSQTLFKLGDFAGAAEAVRPLLVRWQTLSESDRQYTARAFLLAGDLDQAEKLLPSANSDAFWLVQHGLTALLQGKAAAAKAALEQAVQATPGDAWNAYLLGWASAEAGDRNRAIAVWKQAAELPDAPPQAVTGAAELLIQQGDLPTAKALLGHLGKAVEDVPEYWDAWNLLARKENQPVQERLTRGYAAFHRGDPWQAEAVWREALPMAQNDDARELYAALYNSAFRRHDMDAAFRTATEAAVRWPADPYFLKCRAEVLLGQNLLPQALAEAEKLKKVAPPEQETEVTELLSRIALDYGKPELLEQNAKRHLELQPSDPDPLLHQAEWQAQQGRSAENLEKTLALYRKAIEIAPQNAEAYARAGIVLADSKRSQEAVTMLLHALTLSPRVLDGTPNATLAQLYRKEGREREQQFEESQYALRRKAKDGWPTLLKILRQDRPLAEWKALGDMALERRETWIALCAFTHCTRQAPTDPTLWQSLAATQKRLGRFEEALKSMQHAQRLPMKRS